jgi:hypothetical protein
MANPVPSIRKWKRISPSGVPTRSRRPAFRRMSRAAGVISEVGMLAAAPERVLRQRLIELEDAAYVAPAHEIRHFRVMPEEAG